MHRSASPAPPVKRLQAVSTPGSGTHIRGRPRLTGDIDSAAADQCIKPLHRKGDADAVSAVAPVTLSIHSLQLDRRMLGRILPSPLLAQQFATPRGACGPLDRICQLPLVARTHDRRPSMCKWAWCNMLLGVSDFGVSDFGVSDFA